MGIAPANHEPARVGLTPLRATAPIPDYRMEVPDRLLRLGDGDPTSPKLVQGGLRSEQLSDGVGHPLSMIDAWDIPAGQSSNNDHIQAKNGVVGKVLEISVAPDPAAPRRAIWDKERLDGRGGCDPRCGG
jgi:hypothetical protein